MAATPAGQEPPVRDPCSALCVVSLGAAPHMPLPSLPPEFMQAVAHQITQQAMAAAASSATGNHPQNTAASCFKSAAPSGSGKGRPQLLIPPFPPPPGAIGHHNQVLSLTACRLLIPAVGQQVPGFQSAPTRVVIARPSAPSVRPTHPGSPQAPGQGVRNGAP